MRNFIFPAVMLCALLLFGCTPEIGGGAGIGADFDPSQYYTKAEVDEKLASYALVSQLNESHFRTLAVSSSTDFTFNIPANSITKGIVIIGSGCVSNLMGRYPINHIIEINSAEISNEDYSLYDYTYGSSEHREPWAYVKWIESVDWTVDNEIRFHITGKMTSFSSVNICVFGY